MAVEKKDLKDKPAQEKPEKIDGSGMGEAERNEALNLIKKKAFIDRESSKILRKEAVMEKTRQYAVNRSSAGVLFMPGGDVVSKKQGTAKTGGCGCG